MDTDASGRLAPGQIDLGPKPGRKCEHFLNFHRVQLGPLPPLIKRAPPPPPGPNTKTLPLEKKTKKIILKGPPVLGARNRVPL